MRFNALSRLLPFCVVFSPVVNAIFADEAYRIDYHHALLGTPQPQNTFFHRPSASSKASLLYTLSEKQVLGAVNPKDGAIVWRQYLAADGVGGSAPGGFLKASEGEDTVITAVGGDVRAWDAADGRLVWEWKVGGIAQDLKIIDIAGGSKDVLVLSAHQGHTSITRIELSSGKLQWEIEEESGDIPVALSTSTIYVFYVSLYPAILKGYKVKVTSLDPVTGKVITGHSEGEVTSRDSIIHIGSGTAAPVLVLMDKASKALKISVLGSKAITTHSISSRENEPVDKITVHAPEAPNAQTHFLIHYQSESFYWAEVYHVELSSKTVNKAYDLPNLGGKGAFSVSTVDANVYFTRISDFEVSLFSSASHGILERWAVRDDSHDHNHDKEETHEGIEHSVTEVASKGGSGFATRSAVVLPSGDWVLIRNGDPVWLRPEGLAGVVAVAWADIPQEEGLVKELQMESHNNVLSAYIHRVKRHVRDLQYLPHWIQQIPMRVISNFVEVKSSPPDLTLQRDSFGFRKIVIVATGKGRVLALDAGAQGKIIWNVQTITLPAGSFWDVTSIESDGDSTTIISAKRNPLVFETMTGHLKNIQKTSELPDHERLVPVRDRTGRKVLMTIVDHETPRQPESGDFDNSTIIVIRRSDHSLAGWTLADSVDGKPTISWEFVPMPGETVSTITTRPVHDPVASIGKALGDRNVLYKYLSPNLILVTATNPATSSASIYLLDSVTGRILYTTNHPGVDTSLPIPATLSENYFAYTLFADPLLPPSTTTNTSTHPLPKAHILILSELYESSLPNDRGPLASTIAYSAALLPPPHVVSAAYVLPARLTALTTTSTAQGITPRSLLATIPSLAALLAIPLPFLSPRRPVGRDPTPAEREEGLFPYTPVLEINPHWVLSHKREVLGIKGVSSCPTLMESTSLVVAWGEVDFFGTRVAPIGAFDLLGAGFSRLQLVGTVVALGVGTAILAPMVRRKQINQLWTS